MAHGMQNLFSLMEPKYKTGDLDQHLKEGIAYLLDLSKCQRMNTRHVSAYNNQERK